MSQLYSPFNEIPPEHWIASNNTAFAAPDRFPVSPGHSLVVTKRQVATWWDATRAERLDLIDLVDAVKEHLDAVFRPSGYNVGFNAGESAGQTIPHLHLHVIPRYLGDSEDPAGGIRHVLPGGNYVAQPFVALLDNRDQTVRKALEDCLRDRRFDRTDLIVSFVMQSGVRLLEPPLQDALDRGVVVRLLTTDYLETTEPEALARLLDLAEASTGQLEVRVFSDAATSFHPKGYHFWSSSTGRGVAVIGSSNLSRSGIERGVEWNLFSGPAVRFVPEFEQLWDDARSEPLTHDWLRRYQLRVPPPLERVRRAETDTEAREPVELVWPRPIQEEALIALKGSQQAGYGAGLVVMATGLGKTWIAAFYARELQAERVLFVAHREEILRQSRDVFRRVLPDKDVGMFTADERALDADFVFASVQSLGRHLAHWSPDHFDVIVVDEFHHAAAPTYRRIIDYFVPEFLLGLTATPERLDGADLLALCGGNLVFECGLAEGIGRGELCPFEYWAEKDVADFASIPWRNGRFDPAILADAIETNQRASQELEAWRRHGGRRTLGFCQSQTHSDFMADFFTGNGVRALSVHSGPTSAPRQRSLEQLQAGHIDVIFSVDLFNEGVDLPDVDTVLMLRPTDSPVVFLQQLGRGLRSSPGKERLTVVDFIGNHRTFFFKPRTLLALSTGEFLSTAKVLEAMATGDFGLPEGCSVHYDLEVVDILSALTWREEGRSLVGYCQAYAVEQGRRPTAAQAWLAGYNPGSQRQMGWFGALDRMGLLEPNEQETARTFGDVLLGIERESITKSYKLVTLQAFLEEDGLGSGVTISRLAARSRQILRGDPRLVADVGDHLGDDEAEWQNYWRQWPIAAWTGELRGSDAAALFRLDDDSFKPRFDVPVPFEATMSELLAELVDYRLCRYLAQRQSQAGEWRLRVGQTNGRPLIWLGRERNNGLPAGEVSLRAEDQFYTASFVKIALNVLRDPVTPENRLPELLRRWFGEQAGAPGTAHMVFLRKMDEYYEMEPVSAERQGVGS